MKLKETYNVQAESHGRGGGRLKAGTYIVRIDKVEEDVTGYGNQSLKLVYDVAEGECTGIFAEISGDADNDWRHTIEVDCEENNGGRLNSLIKAVALSNPGFPPLEQWVDDANEQLLVGKFVGVTFQERQVTGTRGKSKGKMVSYLDLWDFIPIEQVRSGNFEKPPVNDRRDYNAEAQAASAVAQQEVPVGVPQGLGTQAVPNAVPTGVPAGVPAGASIAPAPVVPQGAVAQVPGAQAPQYPQQTVQYQQQPVQPSVTQSEFASQDIPF